MYLLTSVEKQPAIKVDLAFQVYESPSGREVLSIYEAQGLKPSFTGYTVLPGDSFKAGTELSCMANKPSGIY